MKRRLVPILVLVLTTIGAGSPAIANHGKRCAVAVHRGPGGTVVSENVPEQVPDVHLPLGLGQVKVFVDCNQHK